MALNPPPTTGTFAKILPLQTQYGQDQPYYVPYQSTVSGGGGGGSNNPNPSFSTININPGGGIIMNTDAFGDNPNLQFNTSPDGSLSENLLYKDAETGNLSDGGRFLALQYFTPGLITAGILGVRGINFSPQFQGEPGAGVIGVATGGTTIYATNVSTINGIQYPPGQGDQFPNLEVQFNILAQNISSSYTSVAHSGGTCPLARFGDGGSRGAVFIEGVDNGTPGGEDIIMTIYGSNNDSSLKTPGIVLQTLAAQDSASISPLSNNSLLINATTMNVSTVNVAAALNVSTVNVASQANMSSISFTGLLTGSGLANLNIYNESLSGNNGTGGGLPAGYTAPQLRPLGIPLPFGIYPTNMVQCGYCDTVPYTSTILFSNAYPNDTRLPAVIITPTNKGVSGGANPNMSLNTGFGTAGTGVSTIGFQVDTRNGGVGYNGSFFWMTMPQTV